MERNQTQSGCQPGFGKGIQRRAFVVEKRLGRAQQHTDDAVLARPAARRAVVAVDDHFNPSGGRASELLLAG